jgi:tetratricopeptide (TPR) repeat protein
MMTRKVSRSNISYQRALVITEKALGSDHPSVATRINNLANVYVAQGNYAEALRLGKRALAINEKYWVLNIMLCSQPQ